MAQLIAFPGVSLPAAPESPQRAKKVQPAAPAPKVVSIRRGVPVPKANRPEDVKVASIACLVASYENDAYALAQTEPGSAQHLRALHMTGIRYKPPCSNLRIFTTPEDVVQGLWKANRWVDIANAEFILAELQRGAAHHDRDKDARDWWGVHGRSTGREEKI